MLSGLFANAASPQLPLYCMLEICFPQLTHHRKKQMITKVFYVLDFLTYSNIKVVKRADNSLTKWFIALNNTTVFSQEHIE